MDNQEPLSTFGLFLYIWNHWSDIQNQWAAVMQAFVTLVGTLVTLASIITPMTKTPKDDELLAGVKNWLHQFSFTNARDVKGIGQQPVPPQKTELPTTKKG